MGGLTVSVQVGGLNTVVRSLLELGLDVNDLKDVFAAIARRGAVEAAREAPVASGALAGSARGNRARNRAVIAAGYRSRVPYAGPINYGWGARNITANPFMQRAERRLMPYASKALESGINTQIRRRGLA